MDKQIDKDINVRSKMIEEMAKLVGWNCDNKTMDYCEKVGSCDECRAIDLYNAGYRKIPEGAVVIPKEVSCYDNVEERIRTFKLDGNKVDFTDEQIMAITSIFHYKEMQAEEIRKETAEKFAEQVKMAFYYEFDELIPSIMSDKIDEICKEITGVE